MTVSTSTIALNGAAIGFNLTGVAPIELTFRDRCKAFATDIVDQTVTAIRESFNRRDLFESPSSLATGASYRVNRDKVLSNASNVARFFLALDVAPSAVIERKVSSVAMFNSKALKKIVELANFAVTGEKKLEKVMSAFIVCSLAFEVKQSGAISNAHNKSFLSSLNFNSIVTDSELADYLADYQHAFMSGGKDTQSSQARNVLDVLGLGRIVTCDNRSRGGIAMNSDHAFFADFTAAYCN